jgi:hypothetical protein
MVREVVITPNYENVAARFAAGFVAHDFEKGAREPVISFIQQIRYLAVKDEREGKTGAQDSRVRKLIRRVRGN